MKQLFYITVNLLILLCSCRQKQPSFVFDPAVPYPVLEPGDFWPGMFDQRGLQNAVIYNDRIFCNTIDVGGDHNFLYCLNPANGLTEWRAPVKAYATQAVSYCDSTIIYCSYLGDIAAFNRQGRLRWQAKFDHPYGGHWVDTAHSWLLVKTVYRKQLAVYSVMTGALITTTIDDTLRKLVDAGINSRFPVQRHAYSFERMGNRYHINCEQDTAGRYKIEITHKRREE